MSDIDILHQMIKDTAKIVVSDKSNKKLVALTEPQQTKCSVTIHGLPDDVIVIKADAFRSPDTVFKGTKGECKRADFVIVADTGRKKIILCIEMKSKKGSGTEIKKQLTGAECFALYCQGIGRKFWKQCDFLDGYAYRFVSVSHISVGKCKTRTARSSGTHDHPDRMLKIARPHYLEFSHLAGA